MLAKLSVTSCSARTAKEVAVAAGLKVRPVEEWLCAMSCAGIIDIHVF